MSRKKTIAAMDVGQRRVLMRVDFNVPLNESGQIRDERRIAAALPSIHSVVQRQGRLILMSHLGRPKTEEDHRRLSLAPVAQRLSKLLGQNVRFAGEVVGERVDKAVDRLVAGEVLLLENLRFHPGESSGDAQFATALAALADVYCNDAFGTCHRKDASMVAVPRAMAEKPKVTGLLLERELSVLTSLLDAPQHPFLSVLGGAKISDKIGAVKNLLARSDWCLVGGAMAHAFLAAQGHPTGKSLVDTEGIELASHILELGKSNLVLPADIVCAESLTPNTSTRVVPAGEIPAELSGFDIGPDTVARFLDLIRGAKTVFWNGPLGAFETPPFDTATRAVADALALSEATTVIGGGDTAAAIDMFGLANRMTHISTGGGASLALLAGERLEAIELLDDA